MKFNQSIVLLVLGFSLHFSLCSAGHKKANDFEAFKQTMSQNLDGFREWLIKGFGYGHDALAHMQSVEMLPYRYVFLTSFLGGLTGAFAIYCFYKINDRKTRTEIETFTHNLNEAKDYPLTFRTHKS